MDWHYSSRCRFFSADMTNSIYMRVWRHWTDKEDKKYCIDACLLIRICTFMPKRFNHVKEIVSESRRYGWMKYDTRRPTQWHRLFDLCARPACAQCWDLYLCDGVGMCTNAVPVECFMRIMWLVSLRCSKLPMHNNNYHSDGCSSIMYHYYFSSFSQSKWSARNFNLNFMLKMHSIIVINLSIRTEKKKKKTQSDDEIEFSFIL